jgi:hypothetical protein
MPEKCFWRFLLIIKEVSLTLGIASSWEPKEMGERKMQV